MNDTTTYCPSWCCTDCLMLIAYDEMPPEMDELATDAWLAEIARRSDGGHWTLGMAADYHDQDCPNINHETGEWLGNADCSCEEQEFSWRQCEVCGSTLGGTRHAVTYWAA